MANKEWSVSNVEGAEMLGYMEFTYNNNPAQAVNCDVVNFIFLATPERVVFGTATNSGFLESGYIERQDDETIDQTCAELVDDIDVFYNDGIRYCNRIVCNERM